METPKYGEVIEVSNMGEFSALGYATGERHHHHVESGKNMLDGKVMNIEIYDLWRYPGETEWKR